VKHPGNKDLKDDKDLTLHEPEADDGFSDRVESGPVQPQAKPQPRHAKPKPPVNVISATLTAMGDVKPVSSNEVLDDDIPW